jgi:hypothetical protein
MSRALVLVACSIYFATGCKAGQVVQASTYPDGHVCVVLDNRAWESKPGAVASSPGQGMIDGRFEQQGEWEGVFTPTSGSETRVNTSTPVDERAGVGCAIL